jgi:iron complex transport system substrate-binding protein
MLSASRLAASALRVDCRERVKRARERAAQAVADEGRPQAIVLDWTDAPIQAGHWVRDMVDIAGSDPSFQPDSASEPVAWDDVRGRDPDALVVASCGFDRDRAVDAVGGLAERPGWCDLTTVADCRLFAADGDALFNRPSHRVIESLEVLFACPHPERAVTPPAVIDRVDQVAHPDDAGSRSVRADGG